MRTYNRTWLFTSAICATLSTVVIPVNAYAFDDVKWKWNKSIKDNVVKDVKIKVHNNPTGIVQIEKIQTQIGDVTAASTVSGIHNNAPVEGDGTATINQTISLNADYDDNLANNPITGGTVNAGSLTATGINGNVDNNGEKVNVNFELSGEVEVDPHGTLDAIDLPKVESSATAVGNNQSIESNVALDLHDAQFLYGGYNAVGDVNVATNGNPSHGSGNSHADIAEGLTVAGALGSIHPASITATSDVSDILNASVDSSATAVGNNMDVKLAARTVDDMVMTADLIQYSYADVSAASTVADVTVNDYTNFGGANMGPLGDPQIPLVKSAATAVGNNMSIKVTSPVVD